MRGPERCPERGPERGPEGDPEQGPEGGPEGGVQVLSTPYINLDPWSNSDQITSHHKYFIQLTACGAPEEGFAECCFEDEPLFYMITIIDHVANKDMVIIIHYVIELSSFFSSPITGQSI